MNAPQRELKLTAPERRFRLLDEVSRTRPLTDDESRDLEQAMMRIRVEVLKGDQ
jgi:hypothetical protein